VTQPEISRWIYRNRGHAGHDTAPVCQRCGAPIDKPSDAVMLGRHIADDTGEIEPIHMTCVMSNDSDLGMADIGNMGKWRVYVVSRVGEAAKH